MAYRWRSLPRVRRHRAGSPRGSSSNGCCHFAGHHGPIGMRLSFRHPLLAWSGYVESIVYRIIKQMIRYIRLDDHNVSTEFEEFNTMLHSRKMMAKVPRDMSYGDCDKRRSASYILKLSNCCYFRYYTAVYCRFSNNRTTQILLRLNVRKNIQLPVGEKKTKQPRKRTTTEKIVDIRPTPR